MAAIDWRHLGLQNLEKIPFSICYLVQPEWYICCNSPFSQLALTLVLNWNFPMIKTISVINIRYSHKLYFKLNILHLWSSLTAGKLFVWKDFLKWKKNLWLRFHQLIRKFCEVCFLFCLVFFSFHVDISWAEISRAIPWSCLEMLSRFEFKLSIKYLKPGNFLDVFLWTS